VSKADRPEQEPRCVNLGFPVWMIHSLDEEAKRLGVPGQSIIEVWVAERLKKENEVDTIEIAVTSKPDAASADCAMRRSSRSPSCSGSQLGWTRTLPLETNSSFGSRDLSRFTVTSCAQNSSAWKR
jgi:hypothetical protein